MGKDLTNNKIYNVYLQTTPSVNFKCVQYL